jgi:HNH endonuclease
MKNGYLGIKIKGKGTTVHAAVASAFHGPKPSKSHAVNHKSGIKSDNTPENLEWLTNLENMRHAVETLGIKFGGKPRRPPLPEAPMAGTLHQTVQVLDGAGRVLHTIALHVPTAGRCDQHAAVVDGARCDRMLTATDVGRMVSGMVRKRPSVAIISEWRADLTLVAS